MVPPFPIKRAGFLLVLVAVLGVNLWCRAFPIYFPQLKAEAARIVDENIRQSVIREVQSKFPQFYIPAKEEIVRSKIAEIKKADRIAYAAQVKNIYRQLKDRFQDDRGQTYLMELDCWHWARYVDNVVKLGHPGDRVIGGAQWDRLMIAPTGMFLLWEQFFYYLSAYLYAICAFFIPVPVFTFLFYLPLVFITIYIASLFVFIFRDGKYIGAILACLYVGLAPMFIPRSCAGWFDTDILNLLLPLAVVMSFVRSIGTSRPAARLAWLCLAGSFVGIFCGIWTHWWFVLFIVASFDAFHLLYFAARQALFKRESREDIRRHAVSLAGFLSMSAVWVIIIAGLEPFTAFAAQARQALTLNKPLMATIWPNVLSTVGELRPLEFRELSRSIGPMWVLVISLAGFAMIVFRAFFANVCDRPRRASIFIAAVWFVSMYFASTRGVRFLAFLLFPVGASLGWAIQEAYEMARRRKRRAAPGAVLILAVVIAGALLTRGMASAKSIYPLMDDGWYKFLTIMRDKTTPDTVINSWWDYGDWFKAVAGRPVIFDGQSQHLPQAYWMAKAMLVDDEERSAAILRMINSGGNKAFEIMSEYIPDQLQAVLALESILPSDPDTARGTLARYLPPLAVDEVMKLLFAPPPRAGFVVDSSMPYKMPAISFIGDWNFAKAYIAKNYAREEEQVITERLKTLGGKSDDEIARYYQEYFLLAKKPTDEWLSERLQFYSGTLVGREKEGLIVFDSGLVYDPKQGAVQTGQGQTPRSFFLEKGDGNIVETVQPGANVPYSVLIYKNDDGAWRAVCLDRALGKSIFIRLYYLNGRGLRHFMPLVTAAQGDSYLRYFMIAW